MTEKITNSEASMEVYAVVTDIPSDDTCENIASLHECSTTSDRSAEPVKENPMLEVHAPHQPINTWKDVFIHIGIIVVGLCIAVGLDEIVIFFHHRYEIKETREALRIEREKNHKNIETDAKLWRVNVVVLQNNLAVFEYLLKHPVACPIFCTSEIVSVAQRVIDIPRRRSRGCGKVGSVLCFPLFHTPLLYLSS